MISEAAARVETADDGQSSPDRAAWTFDDQYVRNALALVRKMMVGGMIGRWHELEKRAPGGRPAGFPSFEHVLLGRTLAASKGSQLLTDAVAMLCTHLSDEMATELSIPLVHADGVGVGTAIYRRFERRNASMLNVMDPSPLPKNRRLGPAEFNAQVRNMTSQEIAEKERRLLFTMNQIIGVSRSQLPRATRRAWKGRACVDDTHIAVFARPPRKKWDARKPWKDRETEVHSADPDAGWYIRHADRDGSGAAKDPNAAPRERAWAVEIPLVVAVGTERAGDPTSYPRIAVGIGLPHRPGTEPGENAVLALAAMRKRGLPAEYLAGDRAYSNARPEKFQLPAKSLGYKLVFDYRQDQLGLQPGHAGSIQVEGTFYCPSMPTPLVEATQDCGAGRIDETLWKERLAARRAFELKPLSRATPIGQRMICPASGQSPTCACPLKPESQQRARGKTPVTPSKELTDFPATVCTQTTVSIPITAGAKLAQPLPYGSPEWNEHYGPPRAAVEGYNGFVKDPAHENLGEAGKRRVRGIASAGISSAFLVLAANLRMIDDFLAFAVVDPDGTLRKPTKRSNRTRPKSLVDFDPRQRASRAPP